MVHEGIHRFMLGHERNAHPMGMLVGIVGGLSTFYHDDLNVNDVFERCLSLHEVPEEQRPDLLRAYQETLTSLYHDDAKAE